MPCEPDAFVDILMRAETSGNHEYYADPQPANEWGWGIRQSNTEIIGWRYASSDQPKAEPTELERLRGENRLMQVAIKLAISSLIECREQLDRMGQDGLRGRATVALSKLQPFIKS